MIIGFDAKRAFHNHSGLGNYSRDLIRILQTGHPKNKYILYNPKVGEKDPFPASENLEVHYPNRFLWRRFSGAWRQGPIVKQITEDNVDIYHGLSGEIPRGIEHSPAKVLVTIHDLIFIRYPELFKPIDRKIYNNKFKYAADHANLVIAISEQTKADIMHFFGTDPRKIRVHYQGCHPAFKIRYSEEQRRDLQKRLQLPDRFILNVGTIERRKNVLSVLQAVRTLPYQVVIVGKPTNYKLELEEFIVQNQMEDRVRFIEGLKIEQLAILYQMATLFCYPSIFEGFGIPIIEALFSKTVVITSSGSCFLEAGGPDSVYIKPGDIASLQTALAELMENEGLRSQKEESGYRFVQKFRDENIGDQLMGIYRELL